MSSSSLNIVENTTVTRSALASTYIVSSSLNQEINSLPSQSFINGLPIVNDGSLVAFFLFLLELKVSFKHGSETMPLEESNLGHDFFPVGWNVGEVNLNGHVKVVLWRRL